MTRWVAVLAGTLAAGATLTQCSAAPPPPTPAARPSSTASSAPAGSGVRTVTAAELGARWRPGCPVEPAQLRRVEVDHIGFDGETHRGELIVHEDLVPEVITIFERLYRLRYPGSDHWSQHAYGRAIDLNPRLNPCVYANGHFEPHNAANYLDRGRTDPGLLHSGDPAVRVFTDRGWRWGGYWTEPIDYQHFERP